MPARRLALPLAALLVAAVLVVPPAARVSGAAALPSLPSLPSAWPSTRVELGLADAPGGAAALHAAAPFGFRYQYLAGGVNTGNGWATWNSNGQFVTYYVNDSAAHGASPVFPYYMLLQSNPANGATEAAKDLSNLRNTTTMAAYFADLRLFFARAKGSAPVILHVEPDLWGYVEQNASRQDDATSVPAAVASSGDADLAGVPNTAAGFAQAVVRLRNKLAPNVLLAYHLSVWGTNRDISYSNDADAVVDALATRAAAFYRSLGASFDIAFTDIADRDAQFKAIVYGDGGASRWDDADFVRYERFIAGFVAATGRRVVIWQIPLGNTKMRAQNDTWGHYQDNRVEWFLDDPSGTHLARYRDAGVVALLFGGGADGTTCACDATGDGVTNPAPIDGNGRTSLNADDDGGYFKERAAAYYAGGGLRTDAAAGAPDASPSASPDPSGSPAPTSSPAPVTTKWSLGASVSPTSVLRGRSVTVTVRVRVTRSTRALVHVDVYDPGGRLAFRHWYAARTLTGGVTTVLRPAFRVAVNGRLGTYVVKIRVYRVGGGLLAATGHAASFRVRN